MRRKGYSLRGLTIWMETKSKMAAGGVLQVLILKYRGKSTLKGKEEVTDEWGPEGRGKETKVGVGGRPA